MKKSVYLMFLGMIVLPQISHAVPLTAEHLYTFARQKNEKLLDKYSKHIDITNKNNDTALCISVRRRDRDSFELLKDYGASTKVDCLQKMLKKSVVKQDNTSAVVSNSDGEFLGMGLKGWGITGLAVAGIAVASSGGGGSSSGSNEADDKEEIILNCQNGTQVGDKCECYFGYEGELCDALKVGYEENGRGEIVCSSGYGKNGTEECVKKDYTFMHTRKSVQELGITIDNDKFRDVIGMYSSTYAYAAGYYGGAVTIKNNANGNLYGVFSKGSGGNVGYKSDGRGIAGHINIENIGNGDVFGVYAKEEAFNVKYMPNSASGYIIINNNGDGNVYGIFSQSSAYNSHPNGEDLKGEIEIVNNGSGISFGMAAPKVSNESYRHLNSAGYKTKSSITMKNAGKGLAIGMFGTKEIKNSGSIIVQNGGYGSAIGIYTAGGEAINSRNITIEGGNLAIGIYGEAGSNITNSGTITITGADTSYGIYAEDDTVTVSNTGTISIDGDTNHANAIKLNGGKLFQDGELIAQNIALNDFGGEIIANSNSKFVAEDKISGDLSVSADVVQNGFDKTYTSKDVISAKDVNELNLSSKSALFDAKLENDSDIVMEMKEFGDVVDDKSVANFLSDNYSNQNNEKLFNNLKGIENTKALNSALSDMTGKEMFNRMAFEDLTMAREFNFDLNSKLFNNKEENLTTSGSISPWMFSGASNSQTRYSLNNMTIGNNTVGLAVALTDVNTNDGNGKNTRNDKMYQMAMPVGYSAYGFDFITTPSVGYSYGTYNRVGFDNTNYKGTLEKQTFGLMNEARYPFMMAGWNLNLALEFNVMGYRVSGDEGSKEFGLNIAKQDSFSVETGIGLYANKDIDISKDSKLKLYNGVAFYKEFADPYKMKVGMNGMSGTYTLRDENRGKNRAVVRTGFDYTSQDLSLYGSLSSYIDHELQTNADIGLKYNF